MGIMDTRHFSRGWELETERYEARILAGQKLYLEALDSMTGRSPANFVAHAIDGLFVSRGIYDEYARVQRPYYVDGKKLKTRLRMKEIREMLAEGRREVVNYQFCRRHLAYLRAVAETSSREVSELICEAIDGHMLKAGVTDRPFVGRPENTHYKSMLERAGFDLREMERLSTEELEKRMKISRENCDKRGWGWIF